MSEPRDVATRARQTGDETRTHRVDDDGKHDGDGDRRAVQGCRRWRRRGEYNLGLRCDEFRCESTCALAIRIRPALLNPRVAAVDPTQSRWFLHECGNKASKLRIAHGPSHQQADASQTVRLFRAYRERPRECGA